MTAASDAARGARPYRRVGIIGAGVIGRAVYEAIAASGLAEVAFVLNSGASRPDDAPQSLRQVLTGDPEEALARPVDLVIEAARPEVVSALGPRILAFADLCCFSCSALADRDTERAVLGATEAHGSRFLLPHGAVLGLDGLSDGRDLLEEVLVTTTKSGKSLGLSTDAAGVIFDGSTRDACGRFPRNVNVHAAVALAGIGFDRTRSVVVADPAATTMSHRIQVSGQGLRWDISVTSRSLGGVSGSYTPRSAVGTVQRLLNATSIVNV